MHMPVQETQQGMMEVKVPIRLWKLPQDLKMKEMKQIVFHYW
jgi:hypothetical protein